MHCVRQIGSGAFGDVYLYEDKETKELMAMKIKKKDANNGMQFTIESRVLEIITAQIKATNGMKRVPTFHGDTFCDSQPCLKLEYIEHSIESYIQEKVSIW